MSEAPETLGEFKDSFSYGSRTDLNFKFLKRLSDDEAGEFFRQLLFEVGETFDSASLDEIHDLVYRWQVKGYESGRGGTQYVYEERPFTAPLRAVAEATVGLVASSGHFVTGDDPEPFGVTGMTQEEATARIQEFMKDAPRLSAIPVDTPRQDLRLRHPGYDIRSVGRDPGVALPIDLLADLAAEGAIGGLAPLAYSFPGAASQGRLRRVIPQWVASFAAVGIDVLLLVPV